MNLKRMAVLMVAAAGFAGLALAARMQWDFDRSPASRSTQMTNNSSPPRPWRPVTGGQPLLPWGQLTLSGDITALVPGESVQVTVTDGDRSYPAQLQGQAYTVTLPGRAPGTATMVKVEVRSTRVRYVSVLGSYDRLKTLAGADWLLSLDEQPALHVSPYSTALALLTDSVRGGVAATTDLEFERALRATTGAEVITATYLLESYTRGTEAVRLPATNGYEMI